MMQEYPIPQIMFLHTPSISRQNEENLGHNIKHTIDKYKILNYNSKPMLELYANIVRKINYKYICKAFSTLIHH